MKSLFRILLFLTVFSGINANPFIPPTLEKLTGATSYYWFGGGFNDGSWTQPTEIKGYDLYTGTKRVASISALHQFKVHRFFQDNYRVVNPTLPLVFTPEPTQQRFWNDSYMRLCKAHNISTIWTVQGLFPWQDIPINPSTGKPYSQRKTACYDLNKSPSDFAAWTDLAELCRQIALYYKTNPGLLDILQILNEWDFRWNVPHVLTPEEYAVCFVVCEMAIRSVNPDIKIMTGGTINPTIDVQKRFVAKRAELYRNLGITPDNSKVCLDFHWYFRDGSNNQGGGTRGISPESARAYQFGLQMDSITEVNGFAEWWCTETGYSTDESCIGKFDCRQLAPALEGYTSEQAQGILTWRLSLIWGANKYCGGITNWHCRDLYDSPPYAYAGYNYKDWAPKPGKELVANELSKYGNYYSKNFRWNDSLFAVDVYCSTDTTTLVWTNYRKLSKFDAYPKEGLFGNPPPNNSPTNVQVISPLPGAIFYLPNNDITFNVTASDPDGYVKRVEIIHNNQVVALDSSAPFQPIWPNVPLGNYAVIVRVSDNLNLATTINGPNFSIRDTVISDIHLQVQNVNDRPLVFWSNGEQAVMSHADSPEGWPNASWRTDAVRVIGKLPQRKINMVTMTLRGDDVTSINIDTEQEVRDLKSLMKVFVDSCEAHSLKPIFCFYLGERTNFNSINLAAYKTRLDLYARILKEGEDYTGYCIWGIEEVGQSWSACQIAAWWNPINRYIKQVMSKSLTMLHNNPNRDIWLCDTLQVDGIHVQQNVSAGGPATIAKMEQSANVIQQRGYYAHLHECYNCFHKSNYTQQKNLDNLELQLEAAERIGCKCSAIFDPSTDTQRPHDTHNDYLHVKQGETLYGVTGNPPPPNPSNIHIYYSSSSSRAPSIELDGMDTIAPGNGYIFVGPQSLVTPIMFNLRGPSTLSPNPRSENGWQYDMAGGSASANAFNFLPGVYTLGVTSGGNLKEVTIVVGNGGTNPPNPTPPSIQIFYSFNSSRSNALEFTSSTPTLPKGNIYIFAAPQSLQVPVRFTLTGPKNHSKSESGWYYDMNGGGTNANAFHFTPGTYTLKVESGTQSKTVTFNIQ